MPNSADPDQKPNDLDLHCLQRQGISGFSRTRVKCYWLGANFIRMTTSLGCNRDLFTFAVRIFGYLSFENLFIGKS